MDSSSISLSVLRSSSKTSPIPLSFVPPTTLIGYRWACLRIKYKDSPIKPLNCPWLSYLRSYSHLVLLLFLDGALDLILFETLIQLIVAPPYFNSMGRMGVRSGYGSLTRNKITRSGFAWGGLTFLPFPPTI
uniref:hypothetical protein n=1 Tax=Arctium tomentosum TaxID=4218 RepID=UPI001D118E07|nr:hypothetical protein LK293_mgp009 [Arctium tomentosum]YP_010195017.1 hypothetical protein LK294_mgp009 [Arctium lappa]QZZ81625.1 hypothetical protein [Arctium tomentosum]QZZ81756.1 hypothetical protein [Arctium lappa]